MRYLAMLYGDENHGPEPGTAEFDSLLAAYGAFDAAAGDAVVGGEALEMTATAVTVRPGVSGVDAPLVTNGPFAETTEAIGGFYVLEAATLDDAIQLARQIPAATVDAGGHGGVELRPLVEWWTRTDDGGPPWSGDRYLAMIYSKETAAEIPNTPEWERGAAEHGRFIEQHREALDGGAALHPVASATTVRVHDGKLLVTDGPFTETAEVIGGFYLLHAASRDDAVAVAADMPVNPGGDVELRPIMELGD